MYARFRKEAFGKGAIECLYVYVYVLYIHTHTHMCARVCVNESKDESVLESWRS